MEETHACLKHFVVSLSMQVMRRKNVILTCQLCAEQLYVWIALSHRACIVAITFTVVINWLLVRLWVANMFDLLLLSMLYLLSLVTFSTPHNSYSASGTTFEIENLGWSCNYHWQLVSLTWSWIEWHDHDDVLHDDWDWVRQWVSVTVRDVVWRPCVSVA